VGEWVGGWVCKVAPYKVAEHEFYCTQVLVFHLIHVQCSVYILLPAVMR
jgi:hypothetical protein